MYFNKTFFNEQYEPQSIQLICEKCGEYIEVKYNENYINKVQPEYCVVTNGKKIVCKCGNECQNGLIEPKKLQKIVYTKRTNMQSDSTLNVPKCPTCNSTNIEKISITKKAFGGALYELFSTDVRNTMHCKNCGYKW